MKTVGRATRFLVLGVLLFAAFQYFCGPHSGPVPEIKAIAAEAQMEVFRQALDTYVRDHGRPPTTEQGLSALLIRSQPSPGHAGGKEYLPGSDRIPNDPWEHPYRYASPGERGELYLLESFGADGRPGGTRLDADLILAKRSRGGPVTKSWK